MTVWVYGFANTQEHVPGILIFFGLLGAMLVHFMAGFAMPRQRFVSHSLGPEPTHPLLVGPARAERSDVARRRLERDFENRDIELVVVREDAHGGALVDRRRAQKLVGPADHELVSVRKALASRKAQTSVADSDVVAEEATHPRHGGGVVEGSEDVHVWA